MGATTRLSSSTAPTLSSDMICFYPGSATHGLISAQIGIKAAREASLHRNATADKSVCLSLAIDPVINICCFGTLGSKQKVARNLAVDTRYHMTDNIGSVHFRPPFPLRLRYKLLLFIFTCICNRIIQILYHKFGDMSISCAN